LVCADAKVIKEMINITGNNKTIFTIQSSFSAIDNRYLKGISLFKE
jgi:hypothetical protein